jgi:ribulose-phosphate 3-epimerase
MNAPYVFPTTRPLIAPSLLSSDFARLAEEISAVQQAGADLLHIDVMDGHFVPNITIGPPVVKAMRRHASVPLDVHLMIAAPDRYLADFAKAGADILTVHWEACPHLHRTVHAIKELGALAGVSINPATPVSMLGDILPDLDLVLLMSVNPGFGGQRFIPGVVPKIESLVAMREAAGNSAMRIEIDGGVDADNAAMLVRAGVDILVSGSAIFGSGDYAAYMSRLRALPGE